ncbi:MAG TPA: ATP-binding protein, partial [Geobacteraceae bacterium]|nr:ATP-binding protein [Geobacteraceae bacterium]
MRFPFRTGLRGRYLAGILALLVFVGAVIIVLIQTTVRDRLEKELQKRGVSIAKHFAEVSANPFLTDTIVSIEFLANDYMVSEEDLAYIFAIDRYGKVVAHTFDGGFPPELTNVNPLAPGQSYNIKTIRTEQGIIFDIAAPILKGDMGVVHIGISKESINRSINDVLGRTSWFILAVLFLGGIYSIFFTSAITRPVRELIKGVEAVGSGDLGQRISFTTRDEIGELSGAFNRMGENLKQITVSKEYMDRLVNTMNDALLVLEADGSIRSVNRAFCQLLGYAPEDLVGRPAELVVPADVVASDRQTLAGTAEIVGGKERTLLDRHGHAIPVISSMAGMYDDRGRVQAVIFTAQDISVLKQTQSMLQEKQLSLEKLNLDLEQLVERRTATLARTNEELIDEIAARKETERELTAAKEAAEVASIAKTEFLANMSHEIRTPLNVIIGTTEFLQETATSSEQRDSLTMLQRSGNVLLQLLNDILDLTRIESGKLEIESIPFDVTELMDSICAMLRMQADGKGLELSCQVRCSVPPLLLGDPYRLRQVLVNLVGNAIKFTESGSVHVALEKCSPVQNGIECTFAVRDTGIGIPDGKLQHIFELFTQADASTTRRYGGSGLGLAICQRLVALMG